VNSPSVYKKIAGNGLRGDHGIAVVTTPELERSFRALQQKARAGDYWANIIVKNIEGLTSTQFKPNVYVRQQDSGRFPEFIMSVPAITVYFRKREVGEFLVYKMEVSSSYFDAQKSFERPALFAISKDQHGAFVPKILKDGRLPDLQDGVVAISDSSYKTPSDAAFFADLAIGQTDFSQFAKRNGFHVHFTPGEGKIGGLKNLKQAAAPETSEELRESALLLTRTMMQARKTKGISWVSEGGGSGVLTQAMHMLYEQGISFEDSKHYVFFSDLTTNLVKAQTIAHKLGFKFERKIKSIDYLKPSSVIGSGFGGAYAAAYYRYKNDPEKYTLLKMSADMVKETANAKSTAGVLITAGAAAGFALGVTPSAVGFAAGVTAITALAKSGLPKLYKKIADRF
jgi:hypothetical protein